MTKSSRNGHFYGHFEGMGGFPKVFKKDYFLGSIWSQKGFEIQILLEGDFRAPLW